MAAGGKRRGRAHPKGRQVEAAALAEIRALLGDRPRRRDLLIEHLHLIQDRHGHLSAAHLAALAEEMRLAQAEVYEVATFYAHFEVVKEGEAPPPPLTVRVCDSLPCALAGAERLLASLGRTCPPGVRIVRAPCLGACDKAPAAHVGQAELAPADPAGIAAAIAAGGKVTAHRPEADLGAYCAQGGYGLLRRCLDGAETPEGMILRLGEAGLRGLGGAGFPTGRKWAAVRSAPGRALVAVNADEGEPGTFKDRYYLERDPHRLLEGALIAAWAVGADGVYLYLRDEYPAIRLMLVDEIQKLRAAGLDAQAPIHLRRGAGAYVCGEESAMIESIEGKRGLPRHRPPYVAERGLFGRPTLVNNVETLHWVRDIATRGPDWFATQGRRGHKGLRSFSVSGRVKQPGVKLAPAGITARELIEEYCGGMRPGHRLKAYLPGGASGGILPAALADLALDFGTLDSYGCFVGSHAMIVLSDQDDLRAAARNLMRFFAEESCGQCTPCRVGTEKAVALLEAQHWDEGLLQELAAAMADASICGLGQAAPNPVLSILRHFREERS